MNTIMKTISATFIFILVISIAACDSTQTPPAKAQITNITENELVTGQITQTKTFNQCDSSSVFKTEVQFSDSSAQTNQQQLVLGAEVTGGGEIPGAVKLEIKGSVEKHFSETLQQGQSHFESASIEVPAHTQQEYTINWRETRRTGAVEYVENGETKSISYSYRVGLELIDTLGKDIPCPTQGSNLATPTPGIEDQLAQIIDNYYICINTANPGSDFDYDKCWDLLSDQPGEFQSNMNKNDYKSFWKNYKVTYKLYYCSRDLQNFIDAEYHLYARSDLSVPIGNGEPRFLEYSFALDEKGWRIKGADASLLEIGSYCESQPRIIETLIQGV